MSALTGYKVIELAGIGPGPMGGMMLADMGAEVIRIERPGAGDQLVLEPISGRGKKSVVLNLKSAAGLETLLRLVDNADVLIDPYRPGVCEKLGIGPDVCLARNVKLVFARMTGWGQTGPLAQSAGHDINYIALTGALHAVGRPGEIPAVPLNLFGDMGGGGMLLVNGILAALLAAGRTGQGQVVDVAMVDGVAQLMWMMQGLQQQGIWDDNDRGVNLLDGGAHFYDSYVCADAQYVCIGSIEPQFYALLCQIMDLPADDFADQLNQAKWPLMKAKLAGIFATKTRDEWCALMEGSDVCFAPVLKMSEAPHYAANQLRDVYTEVEGMVQAAPAPRFSATPSQIKHGTRSLGSDTVSILSAFGFNETEISTLLDNGAIVQGT